MKKNKTVSIHDYETAKTETERLAIQVKSMRNIIEIMEVERKDLIGDLKYTREMCGYLFTLANVKYKFSHEKRD